MSLLQKYISQEGLYNPTVALEDEGVTVEDEVQAEQELATANAEAEEARQAIETTSDETARMGSVAGELETQNEVLEGIAEDNNGTIPPEAAAGMELARRAAVAGLGVDPDSEDGQDLVDAPALEGLVDGTVSLEEAQEKNKGMLQKIKDAALKAWEWIKEKVKKFWHWLTKITNIVASKYRKQYKAIQGLTDKEFDERIALIDAFLSGNIAEGDKGIWSNLKSKAKGYFSAVANYFNLNGMTSENFNIKNYGDLIMGGGFMDIAEAVDNVRTINGKVEQGLVAAIKAAVSKFRSGDDGSKMSESADKRLDEVAREWEDKLSKLNNEKIQIGGAEAIVKFSNGKIEVKEGKLKNGDIKQMKRKAMLDCLNQGIISTKRFEKLNESIEKEEKSVKELADAIANSGKSGYVRYVGLSGQVIAFQQKTIQMANHYRDAVVSLASVIGNVKPEAEKAEAAAK